MRTRTIAAVLVTLVVVLAASTPSAGTLNGTIKLGGVILDETGDLSALQETYNVYEGFSVSQVRLDGLWNARNYVLLDLQDLNRDSRKGEFLYRRPGMLKLTAGYDQHRQVFSPDGGVDSKRKDLRAGAELTPVRWLSLSGGFNSITRDGDRLSYPLGTTSVLGTSYDNSLKTGQVTAEVRKDRRGGAVSFRLSDYSDELNGAADRTGRVVSGRLYAPMPFYDKWTNLLRAAYGVRRLSQSDLEYTLANFQYTGILEPVADFQFRYRFDANRIDDHSTELMTDRYQNDVDATWRHAYGRVSAGVGYEMNDDDRTLTTYRSWNAGTEFHYLKVFNASLDYADRVKKDQEELTLLKDVEASQVRAKLQLRPLDDLSFGGDYAKREREFPDIDVETDGQMAGAFGRYARAGWGALAGNYSYSNDEYTDRAGRFEVRSHIVTGRVEIERIPKLRLATGVTYLDIGKDLDIEKSMVFAEGAYSLPGGYRVEVKYNAYNYDDYILLDRYYTANVVQFNLAYDFHLK